MASLTLVSHLRTVSNLSLPNLYMKKLLITLGTLGTLCALGLVSAPQASAACLYGCGNDYGYNNNYNYGYNNNYNYGYNNYNYGYNNNLGSNCHYYGSNGACYNYSYRNYDPYYPQYQYNQNSYHYSNQSYHPYDTRRRTTTRNCRYPSCNTNVYLRY